MATPSTSSASSPPVTSMDLTFYLISADASEPIRSSFQPLELTRKVILEDTVWTLCQQIEEDYNAETGTAFLWKAEGYLLVDAFCKAVREKPVIDFCDAVNAREKAISLCQPSQSDDLTFIITYLPRTQQVSQVPATQADSNKIPDLVDVINQRFEVLCLTKLDPPSAACEPKEYIKIQCSEFPLYDGRVGSHESDRSTMANPIELYHPAFALFRSIVEDSELELPDDFVRMTAELRRVLSKIEEREDPRHNYIEKFFSHLFQMPFRRIVNADNTSPDLAALCPTGLIDWAAICVVDITAELGDSGDPALLGSFQYRQFWLQEKQAIVRAQCCCPSFIVGVAGPWLVILGAIITDGVIVQRLSDYMWLGYSRMLDERSMVITRTLYALGRALEALKIYYQDLQTVHPHVGHLHPRFLPFVRGYIDPETKEEVTFRFVKPFGYNQTCVTFLAIRDRDDQQIVVKFVMRYGAEAHKYMAEKQLAPALMYCGPVVEGCGGFGDLRMVVMDYIDGQTLFRKYRGQDLPNSVFNKIQESLDVFRDGGFVFGDLRRANVMLMNEEGPLESRIRFIDFDWTGKEGDVRYPLNLSSHIEEVAKVMEWEIVRREHEDRLLEAMKGPNGP